MSNGPSDTKKPSFTAEEPPIEKIETYEPVIDEADMYDNHVGLSKLAFEARAEINKELESIVHGSVDSALEEMLLTVAGPSTAKSEWPYDHAIGIVDKVNDDGSISVRLGHAKMEHEEAIKSYLISHGGYTPL